MAWEAAPVDVGQSYLISDPEIEEWVIVTTIITNAGEEDEEERLFCTFERIFDCGHIELAKTVLVVEEEPLP